MAKQGSGRRPQRTALVHDFLLGLRGADRVFLEMCDLWPEADIFTPVYDERGTEGRLAHRRVQHVVPAEDPSQPPHLPGAAAPLPGGHRELRPVGLRPRRVQLERVGARGHLRPGRRARLLLLQPVPLRVERAAQHARRPRRPGHRGPPARALFRRWREWDWVAAQRVDRYITISQMTQARIETFFGRASRVVYPPVDIDALPADRAGRPLPRSVRARLPQADRRGDRGVRGARPAARRGGRRARAARGCASSPTPNVTLRRQGRRCRRPRG